ncbi:MAG: RsmE family RNA methyltransferase [Candidatus Omnitrophota bacterium]|jgi:16S rRNA (uracil1498-N3)-methyltransferase
MHRFFTLQKNISSGKIKISERPVIHHLKDVLALKPGEEVIIFDGTGNEYRAQIEIISNKAVELKIKEKLNPNVPDKFPLTVACAIPKKSKFDDIVDKLTQLGVDRIIPMLTERVIVKLAGYKGILRKLRWEKIALNASEQSKRKNLPLIETPTNIKEVIANSSNFNLKLIPTLEGRREPLKDVLSKYLPVQAKSETVPDEYCSFSIIILIGPEGDFSDEEVRLALNSGFIPVSLGKEVLRVETAAVAAAGFIRFYEND